MSLTNGYLQVPPGIYFNGLLTFTAWVYPRAFVKNARLFDFANGAPSDNVLFQIFNTAGLFPVLQVYFGKAFQDMIMMRDAKVGSLNLFYNDWSHFAIQFDESSFIFYLNGVLSGKRTGAMGPPNVNRTLNYIGKSNWGGDPNVNAILDEVRIYNRVLTQSEIFELMSL